MKSENPSVRVLLLEAGEEDEDSRISVPIAAPLLHRSDVSWNFQTPPQVF